MDGDIIFPHVTKVQRFCLTLTSEARLWYEHLRPIAVDWTGLQEHFKQQYSKFNNSYFMYGGHFIMMRIQKQLMYM